MNRKPRWPGSAIALFAAATIAAAITGPLGSGAVLAEGGTRVSSWITTPDRSQLLSPGPTAVFAGTSTPPAQLITIDPTQTMQPMDGFGASITDSSASILAGLSPSVRDETMRSNPPA